MTALGYSFLHVSVAKSAEEVRDELFKNDDDTSNDIHFKKIHIYRETPHEDVFTDNNNEDPPSTLKLYYWRVDAWPFQEMSKEQFCDMVHQHIHPCFLSYLGV